MVYGIWTMLRRTVAVAAIGFVLTSPAMLTGCDGTDAPPASEAAVAAQSNPYGSAKSTARSSILAGILSALSRAEHDSRMAVIRNL